MINESLIFLFIIEEQPLDFGILKASESISYKISCNFKFRILSEQINPFKKYMDIAPIKHNLKIVDISTVFRIYKKIVYVLEQMQIKIIYNTFDRCTKVLA